MTRVLLHLLIYLRTLFSVDIKSHNSFMWKTKLIKVSLGKLYANLILHNNKQVHFFSHQLGDYHELHDQSNRLLLADVFENFRNKWIEIYEFDPAHFLSAPGLSWQICLKKIGIELELSADIDMLLMVEKGIGGGICHIIHKYAKANNKYIKIYDKITESSYLKYLDASNFYGWTMSQKCLETVLNE